MRRSRLLAATLPLALTLLAACYASEPMEAADNADLIGDPSFAASADSARLSTLADQGAGMMLNSLVFTMALGRPLVLEYGEPTPAAAHAMAMRYLQQAVRRGTAGAPGSAAPMAFRALPPTSTCVPTITGVGSDGLPHDSDKDGVPDDWKIDYGAGCVDQDALGAHRTTYQGSIEFRDTGVGLKSARAIVKGFRVTEEGNEEWGTLTQWAEGDESLVFTATGVTDEVSLVAGQIIPGSDSYFSQDLTTTFVADPGESIVLGSIFPNGQVQVAGEVRIVYDPLAQVEGGLPPNYRVTLSTPTPLHLNPECNGWIDSGVLVGWLNGDSAIGFKATYPGCGLSFETEIFGATP